MRRDVVSGALARWDRAISREGGAATTARVGPPADAISAGTATSDPAGVWAAVFAGHHANTDHIVIPVA